MNAIRRVQGMAAIAALAIGVAGFGRAQSNPPAEQKQSPAAEKKAEAAPKPAVEEAKKKGAGEGIQVHGHWTIEVKDPDGKVAVHREFENSLSMPSGASILGDLLLGYVVVGGFQVFLDETPAGGGTVVVIFMNSLTAGLCSSTGAIPCVGTLTAGPFPNGLLLSGQVVSTTSNPVPAGTITQVSTNAMLCANTASPITPSTVTTVSPAGCISPNTNFGLLTGATLATPVPVAAGQTVAATVQITFM